MHGKDRVEKINRCKICCIILSKDIFYHFDNDNSEW